MIRQYQINIRCKTKKGMQFCTDYKLVFIRRLQLNKLKYMNYRRGRLEIRAHLNFPKFRFTALRINNLLTFH
jgi:hypothetical protein